MSPTLREIIRTWGEVEFIKTDEDDKCIYGVLNNRKVCVEKETGRVKWLL